MHLDEYYHKILMPANRAVSAIRQAGMFINIDKLNHLDRLWEKKIAGLESNIEEEARKVGCTLTYSDKHTANPNELREFLFKGLGLPVAHLTETGLNSTEAGALMKYASIANPRPDDDLRVYTILKIRSLARGRSTYLDAFRRSIREDGAIHAKFNWAKVRTARISAEDPPVHQIPERTDMEVADGVKSCIIPRWKPALNPDDWDPRKYGSCFRWDIAGAEAAIRAAMLTKLFCTRPEKLWEYIRLGKDVHGLTASLIYNVPEGTFGKGTPERDKVGKQVFFGKLFGGSWVTIQRTVWDKARIWLDDDQAKRIDRLFDGGYPMMVELYERDKANLGLRGFTQDGYGRRRAIAIPQGVKYKGFRNGKSHWEIPRRDGLWRQLQNAFHTCANTPTQGMNATDNFWMIALCLFGEEMTPLKVPPMWEDQGGVLFPDVQKYHFEGAHVPGHKTLQAIHTNTVHDSGWGECGPGVLEPTAKVIYRRCTALPFDWRLKSDVPYRIDLQVGPDQAHLRDYNVVAKEFGLEPMPKR